MVFFFNQFDSTTVDFGTVTNSGSSFVSQDSLLTIVFDVLIIDNKQVSGQSMIFDAHVSYNVTGVLSDAYAQSQLLTFLSSSPSVSWISCPRVKITM